MPSPSSRPGTALSRPFLVLPAREAVTLARDRSPRFQFQVPENWRSPRVINPHAVEAEREVIDWFAGLGCTLPEVQRARKFDVAGYVGIPFPELSFEKTVLTAKYLSLWLLWDDVRVERLDGSWRIDAAHVCEGRAPDDMTRFDRGWWQLFLELGQSRSRAWIEDLCGAMATWGEAAACEAVWMKQYQERDAGPPSVSRAGPPSTREGRRTLPPDVGRTRPGGSWRPAPDRQTLPGIGASSSGVHRAFPGGLSPDFAAQMEMRIATIGMFATVYLLEDAYDFELPRSFHAHPTVARLAWLASKVVGIGNDVFSFAKDVVEEKPNLATTLMRETDVSADEALAHLIRMHDDALEEYDRLAASLRGWGEDVDAVIERWLRDVRYASLGFTLWESQAPRYTAHKIVVNGRVIEPEITFVPETPVVTLARRPAIGPAR